MLLSLIKALNIRRKSWMKGASILFGTRHSKFQFLQWWTALISSAKIKMFYQMIWLENVQFSSLISSRITMSDNGIKYTIKMRYLEKYLLKLSTLEARKRSMYFNQWNTLRTSQFLKTLHHYKREVCSNQCQKVVLVKWLK